MIHRGNPLGLVSRTVLPREGTASRMVKGTEDPVASLWKMSLQKYSCQLDPIPRARLGQF